MSAIGQEDAEYADESREATITDVGKRILVGVTYVDDKDQPLRPAQFVGTVRELIPGNPGNIAIEWDGYGKTYLPAMVVDAQPGTYKLKSTGQEIVNPDLLATWRYSEGNGANSRNELPAKPEDK